MLILGSKPASACTGWMLSAILAMFALGTACDNSATGDAGESSGPGTSSGSDTPDGQHACNERYFSKRSFECATIDCGEAMLCTSDLDCVTCADRCTPAACGSDEDCQAVYGGLCTTCKQLLDNDGFTSSLCAS